MQILVDFYVNESMIRGRSLRKIHAETCEKLSDWKVIVKLAQLKIGWSKS